MKTVITSEQLGQLSAKQRRLWQMYDDSNTPPDLPRLVAFLEVMEADVNLYHMRDLNSWLWAISIDEEPLGHLGAGKSQELCDALWDVTCLTLTQYAREGQHS